MMQMENNEFSTLVKRKPFIPSWLDDFGLSPAEFRIYCRIARRGDCKESVPNMAKGCKISENTAWAAIRTLITFGFICKKTRFGQTSIYHLAPVPKETVGSSAAHPLNCGGGTPKETVGTRTNLGGSKVIPKGNPGKVSSPPVFQNGIGGKTSKLFVRELDAKITAALRAIGQLKDEGGKGKVIQKLYANIRKWRADKLEIEPEDLDYRPKAKAELPDVIPVPTSDPAAAAEAFEKFQQLKKQL